MDKYSSAQDWLIGRIGETPNSSLGWFRAGVGFYNKKEFAFAIDCFQKSIRLDPLNYNAYQILARACIAVNRRDDAIEALKESVKLDNPSDWQLLIELTSQEQANKFKLAQKQ
jgi:tetratricopeptide (TPR) repeat protein